MFSGNPPFVAMLNCEPLKDRTTCFCASLKCQHPQIYQKLSYGLNLRENDTVSDIKVPKLPKRLLCEVSRFIDLFLLIVAGHSDLERKLLHQFSPIGTVQKRLQPPLATTVTSKHVVFHVVLNSMCPYTNLCLQKTTEQYNPPGKCMTYFPRSI